MKKNLILILSIIPFFLQAATYYLDAENGNDNNNGLTELSAWQTFKNVNSKQLLSGDTILFKRGTVFDGVLELNGEGNFINPILIAAYGHGDKPIVNAPDNSLYAIRVYNSSYLILSDLEIVNHGSSALATRTGVKLESIDYGTSKSIILRSLDIRDVNGSLVKGAGGGSGILIQSRGEKKRSNFDGLTIEHCTITNCQRNAMIWDAPWQRDERWFPSTNTVVRNNLIRGVPGDGIVPIGCINTLIEFNKMMDCPSTLPKTEAAAGFWPWSCDNTTIQFNEVSDHKAPWDAQGFDSDYNCTNTTIQFNYSHDNDGGFVLICNSGESTEQIGNIGTLVQYNLSINDGQRAKPTRIGMFSPSIHIGGPVKQTTIFRNLIFAGNKLTQDTHRSMITFDSWGGFANQTKILENEFIATEPSNIDLQKSTDNLIKGNRFYGSFANTDSIKTNNAFDLIKKSMSPDQLKEKFLKTKSIANGKETICYVDRAALEEYFNNGL